MAVATVVRWRDGHKASFSSNGDHKITGKYLILLDSIVDDPYAVKAYAQTAPIGPKLPLDREQYGDTDLYVDNIEITMHEKRRDAWWADVNWQRPPRDQQFFGLHPLMRPPTYKIDFIEEQKAVENAYNLEAFEAPGHERPIGTWGPITNTALQETIDPLLQSKWNGVLTINFALPDVLSILALNKKFQNTTNSDTIYGFGERQLEYQVTQSGDQEKEDSISYFNCQTSIEIKETTDRYVNNVGWKEVVVLREPVPRYVGDPYDPSDNLPGIPGEYGLVNVTDGENKQATEPQFLTMEGKRSAQPVSIGYRYLRATPYYSLIVTPASA
jgi:hypothetical protein